MSDFLGIDTSNYTTSAAIYESPNNVLLQEKMLLPVKKGEKGIRQSDAVFHHTVQLPEIIDKLFTKTGKRDISAVGVSYRFSGFSAGLWNGYSPSSMGAY